MNSLILLNEADQSRLHSLIHRNAEPPHPNPDQTLLLEEILASAKQSAAEPDLLTHVGFDDLTTLVSPHDSQDYYRFRIVMPQESDVDQDLISVCMPVAIAVLGRPVGGRVSWHTPAGLREMRIISVMKSDPPAALSSRGLAATHLHPEHPLETNTNNMQNNSQNPQASVVLKDGTMQLAAWSQPFDWHPTIGEAVAIPSQVVADLEGYEPRAVVSRIQQQGNHPERIDLEATCQMKSHERPVIVLNSNRIPTSGQAAVEAHLRQILRFPLISWESSTRPDPVVRFHDPATDAKSLPAALRTGLLDMIYETTSV